MANISKNNIFTNLDYDTSTRVLVTYLLGCGSSRETKTITTALLRHTYKLCHAKPGLYRGVQILCDCSLADTVAVVSKGKQIDVLLFTSSVLPWTIPDYNAIVEDRRTVLLQDDVITEPVVMERKDCLDDASIADIVASEVLPQLKGRKKPQLRHCMLIDTSLDGGGKKPQQYRNIDMVRLHRILRKFDDAIIASYRSTYIVRRGKLIRKTK